MNAKKLKPENIHLLEGDDLVRKQAPQPGVPHLVEHASAFDAMRAIPRMPQTSPKKNWYPLARRLALMLDEAMTIPGIALKHHEWKTEATKLIEAVDLVPGSAQAGGIFRRYQSSDR